MKKENFFYILVAVVGCACVVVLASLTSVVFWFHELSHPGQQELTEKESLEIVNRTAQFLDAAPNSVKKRLTGEWGNRPAPKDTTPKVEEELVLMAQQGGGFKPGDDEAVRLGLLRIFERVVQSDVTRMDQVARLIEGLAMLPEMRDILPEVIESELTRPIAADADGSALSRIAQVYFRIEGNPETRHKFTMRALASTEGNPPLHSYFAVMEPAPRAADEETGDGRNR